MSRSLVSRRFAGGLMVAAGLVCPAPASAEGLAVFLFAVSPVNAGETHRSCPGATRTRPRRRRSTAADARRQPHPARAWPGRPPTGPSAHEKKIDA